MSTSIIASFYPRFSTTIWFSPLVSLVVKKATICFLITTHCCLTCCQEHMLPLGTRHGPETERATPSPFRLVAGDAPADTRDAPRKFTRHASLHRQQTASCSRQVTGSLTGESVKTSVFCQQQITRLKMF